MRIITWNTNLNFSKKYGQVTGLNPDILVIQECERLPMDYFPSAQFHWIGQNEKKGLGVVLFGIQAEVDICYNDKLAYFLPLNLDNGIRLLATWAYNHRAAERFGEGYKGSAADALEHYGEWLAGSGKVIMAGDFNNSVVWDTNKKPTNFSCIHQTLVSAGFDSAWHSFHQQQLGDETLPTLFHTKHPDKRYHIDYCYLKGLPPTKVEIGQFHDWISFSDHMPVVVDLNV